MRRIAIVVALVFLVATFCYAQVPKNPQYPVIEASASSTALTNLSLTGLDVSGNPAFLALSSYGSQGETFTYYLWVDRNGDLLLASHATMVGKSSFPTGDWGTLLDSHTGITTVGEQS